MVKFKFMKRKAPGEIALHLLVSLLFALIAASYIYILVWAFIAGAKTHSEVVMNPFSLPETWNFNHFIEVFKLLEVNGNTFLDMLFNSLWFSLLGVFVCQFTTITFAYVCSKYTFPGKNLVYSIILIALTLPLYGTSGATYKLYYNLGLINSYAQVLLSTGVITVYTLYYMAFFKNLSWTYAEAAMVDGANDFQIYFKVMFPQAKPIFGSLFLTQWIQNWNEYESALVYLPKLPTLPVGIYQFNAEMIYKARLDILFVACVFVSIPAIILFTVFNKTITTSVSVGGIKG